MVEVRVEDVRVGQRGQAHAVILKDLQRERFLSIFIGPAEADSIRIQLRGLQVPRPLTHDLIVGVIRSLGATMRYVVVNDLREDTFYARIVLRTRDNRELSIDSRPSDAIAVAVRMDCPIFVTDEIMDNYAHVVTEEETQPSSESDDDEDLGAFKDFLSSLDI